MNKERGFAILILLMSSLLVYSSSFPNDFHFDDYQILNNKNYRSTGNIADLFFSERGPDNRPVTNSTFIISYEYCGLNVYCYHAVNFGIHAVNGVVLFLLLYMTLKPFYPKRFVEISFFVSLIFLVHPVQTEAVTYIVQRYEILSAMFILLSLLLFRLYIENKNKIFIVFALSCSALAMGSKEIAVSLPVAVLFYDFLIVSEGSLNELKKRWWLHVLFFLTLIFLLYFMRFSLSIFFMDQIPRSGVSSVSLEMSRSEGDTISPFVYFLTQTRVIWTYVRLLIFPIDQNLDYDYPLITSINSIVIISVIGILFLLIFIIILYKRYPIISLSLLWYFIMLAPTSSIAALPDVIFEHRLYLPSIGIILAVVSFLYSVIAGRERPLIAGNMLDDTAGQQPRVVN